MAKRIGLLAAILALLVPASNAQDADEEIPVAIEEVDVTQAIREFKQFEARLEKYRKAVTEGQQAAADIGDMLTELRKTATEENGHNEKEILKAINGYVDGVVGKQAELIDFLQSQRFRISYYASKVAAEVNPEDIAALFGTRDGNMKGLKTRRVNLRAASKDIAAFVDKLSPREFSKATFQSLPAMSPAKQRRLQQLELRYQNAKNGVALAESRLRLVREAERASRVVSGRRPAINVDLILTQMFGALDRIRLQMSSDLLYLEAFLSRYEKSTRTQEIVKALQQLIALQGGLEGPSPGLANVLDWLEESAVRKLTIDEDMDGGAAFPRSSDLLREAYATGRSSKKGDE